MPPRKRRTVTARRVTERERITEDVAITEDDTLTGLPPVGELHHAAGWDPGPLTARHDYLAQRAGQCDRAEYHLEKWAVSTPPGEPVPERLIREAVNILRAGPGATLMELEDGRSI
jgi:hypothetical protein